MPTKSKPVPVYARLRQLCDSDGRSLVEIAEAAGMSKQTLHQVLAGLRRNPTVETVARVLAALGRTWADLD